MKAFIAVALLALCGTAFCGLVGHIAPYGVNHGVKHVAPLHGGYGYGGYGLGYGGVGIGIGHGLLGHGIGHGGYGGIGGYGGYGGIGGYGGYGVGVLQHAVGVVPHGGLGYGGYGGYGLGLGHGGHGVLLKGR